MFTTLITLLGICALSLIYILVIPQFAAVKLLMSFLPQEAREAAKDHPDPPLSRRIAGYLLTAVFAAVYLAAVVFLGSDGIRRGYGFRLLYARYLLFMYGYKIFDILVQDQYIVIRKKYCTRFYPETANCRCWDDLSFNKKNQMIRMIAFPFICVLMAWTALRIGG